jgi:RHS repeat-associated protein
LEAIEYCLIEQKKLPTRNLTASADARLKFTGKERDAAETGYDYFGARYYDSWGGRWLEADPVMELFPGQSAYAYSYNNPINFLDPNGMLDTSATGTNPYVLEEVVVTAERIPPEFYYRGTWYNSVTQTLTHEFELTEQQKTVWQILKPTIISCANALPLYSQLKAYMDFYRGQGNANPFIQKMLQELIAATCKELAKSGVAMTPEVIACVRLEIVSLLMTEGMNPVSVGWPIEFYRKESGDIDTIYFRGSDLKMRIQQRSTSPTDTIRYRNIDIYGE